MKKLFNLLFAFSAVMLAASLTVSCGPQEDPEIAVASVSLSQSSVALEVGGTADLTATVSPSNATEKNVTWSSSNQSVATVVSGKVTAVGEGTAMITAMAGGKSGTCQVTVKKKVIEVSSVTLSWSSINIFVEETYPMSAEVSPTDATDPTVTWDSDNKDVATVDQSGNITALKEGTANITAKAGAKTATCQVIVKNKVVKVSSVTLDQTEVTLEEGQTVTLQATVSPSDATDQSVAWTSDHPDVAEVDDQGNVTGKKPGYATIRVTSGSKEARCDVTVAAAQQPIKDILMEIYNAMDGPNWTKQKGWGTDEDLSTWEGVGFSKYGLTSLRFKNVGLKGELPESIGNLKDLEIFVIMDEPGITGSLPQSFANLTNLQLLEIRNSGLQSIPDVFSGMTSLLTVIITGNSELVCPLPPSLGDSPKLSRLYLNNNCFTGDLPTSWAILGEKLNCSGNRLTGKMPQSFLDSKYRNHFFVHCFPQQKGYGLDVSDVEIHGWQYWVEGSVEDLDGNIFSFEDVVKKSKYTVYINWAPWCPFSKVLMPQLRDFYNKYSQDGLEVIATVMFDQNDALWKKPQEQKQEIIDKGYVGWYNFYYWGEGSEGRNYAMGTPKAEVYDENGNIVFSSFQSYTDSRNRFGKTTSADLIPFLESVLGPAEEPDTYSSTDYSKDGNVMTLHKSSVGKGINIVFMGDGYTDKDMASGGLYEKVMKEAMEEFFAIEPYKTFRTRFNVYAVKVVSKNGRIGEGYTTALGTYFGSYTSCNGDREKCYEYALKVPGITNRNNLLVTVLVNARRHAGIAAMSESIQSSVAFVSSYGNDRSFFGPTLRHEAGGHGFAFLDDEYWTSNSAPSQAYIEDRKNMYQKYGWYSNIDFTNDPAAVKWSAFLSDERYKDEIGIFEGGSTYAKGVYHPSRNSMMNENMEYFNAPSRWAIYKRIMELSGETASFDKFLEYDAVNRGKQQSSAPRTRSARWEPTAPPVVVP
jgi:uncharacterized protein YjdB/thiol-disulfide isomerase/thioredoxin